MQENTMTGKHAKKNSISENNTDCYEKKFKAAKKTKGVVEKYKNTVFFFSGDTLEKGGGFFGV